MRLVSFERRQARGPATHGNALLRSGPDDLSGVGPGERRIGAFIGGGLASHPPVVIDLNRALAARQ